MLDDGTIGDIAAEYLDADSSDGSDESASAGEASITDAE